jgi:thiol-disulfide isomerase/thioredoxin
MRAIAFISIYLLLSIPLMASELPSIKFIEVETTQQWNAAFEKAKAEGKIVFVDVYTDWCGYCHKLDNEVYTDRNVIEYFEANFINVKFDAETEFGYAKAYEFAVDGYPTLLFLTDNETVYEEIGGFVPSATLISYAKDVQNSWSALPDFKAKYERGELTRDEQLEYIGALEKKDYEEAAVVANQYIAGLAPEDYLEIETLWLVSRFQNQIGSAPYTYITTNKALIIDAHGESEYEDYLKAVYNDNLELAIRYGDLNIVNQLIIDVIPEFVPVQDQAQLAYITKSIYYGQREEFDNYILENNAYINNHLMREEKRDWLIQEALEVINSFESEQMYEHALELLQQSISIDEQILPIPGACRIRLWPTRGFFNR